MQRYFFHTETTTRFTDLEGAEFPTPNEARQEAIRTCAEMMRDSPDGFWGSRPWSVTVTNNAGLIFWSLSIDGYQGAEAPE